MELVTFLYPDPFIPTAVELRLDEPTVLSAVVVDERGEEIATLVPKGCLISGLYTIPLMQPSASGSVLFLRLSVFQDEVESVTLRRIR